VESESIEPHHPTKQVLTLEWYPSNALGDITVGELVFNSQSSHLKCDARMMSLPSF